MYSLEISSPIHKYFIVSCGFKYYYSFSAPDNGKPTLLLIHGFPSLSFDWFNQIE